MTLKTTSSLLILLLNRDVATLGGRGGWGGGRGPWSLTLIFKPSKVQQFQFQTEIFLFMGV